MKVVFSCNYNGNRYRVIKMSDGTFHLQAKPKGEDCWFLIQVYCDEKEAIRDIGLGEEDE